MRMLRIVIACVIAVSVCACSRGQTGRVTLQEQASWLKGSPAKLTAIAGAERWLDSADLAAYRDSSGAELVYDRKRDLVLSWETQWRTVPDPKTDTYRPKQFAVPVGTAAQKADARIRQIYKGDFSLLRRRVWFHDQGGTGWAYEFQYDRFINGVRVPDYASVSCSGHTGSAAKLAFTHQKPEGIAAAKSFHPKMDLKTAVTKAANAAGLKEWRFLSAELYVAGPQTRVVWLVKLADTSTPPPGVQRMGGEQWMEVDPLTGDALRYGTWDAPSAQPASS